MKLGLIGVGVVGSAVKKAFEPHFEVVAYDKFKDEFSNIYPVLTADVVFICVPTLTNKDFSQDLGPIEEVCQKLADNHYAGVVVNKCTVLPGTTKRLQEKHSSLRLIHYPEFLTEAKAYEDFVGQKTVILGGRTEEFVPLLEVFQALNPKMDFEHFLDTTSTEMIKYIHNTFLATKVEFCNEMYDICQKLGVSYDDIMNNGVGLIGQVGRNHTKVPGPDGKFGYGGMCFPKDTKALLYLTRQMGLPVPVLEATVDGNEVRRDDLK